MRRPTTYREAFEILIDASVIPQELGEELADLAGFRNVLVHNTALKCGVGLRLDLQRVYEILQHGLTPLRQFRSVIRQFLTPQELEPSEE